MKSSIINTATLNQLRLIRSECCCTVVVVNMDQLQFHAHGELFIRTLAVVLSTDAEVSLKQGCPSKRTALSITMFNMQPDDSHTVFNYVSLQ